MARARLSDEQIRSDGPRGGADDRVTLRNRGRPAERLSIEQQRRDFNILWAGQTLSVFGSAVSMLALPSVAILALHATPFQVGVLEALGYLAFPVLGLIVGVLADRLPRRRIMLVADGLRAAVLGSVPIAAFFHALSFVQLAIVALLMGIGTVFFEISYQSYVPVIVPIADLPRANARLEFTRSIAQIAGNGIAGLLISLVGAARAVAVDASSFVVSIVSLMLIQTRETKTLSDATERTTIVADIRVGLAFVFGSPVLRSIAGCTATSNVGASMLSAVLLIFAYRDLHLKAVTVGLIFAFANVGFVGALLATKCANRFGVGRTLAASIFVGCAAPLLLPLALLGMPIVVLYVVELLTTIAVPIYNINQISLRQTLVPPALQGRMNATMRTIVWGVMPLGALMGGVLGSAIGVLPTIIVAGLISTSAVLWIVATPAGRVRSIAAELSV